MKKTNILLFFLLLSLSCFFIGCDKGTDSVDFTYSQDAKDPRLFYFKASGSSDFGSFSYTWDFGNNNTSTGEQASHTFDSYGTHTVTLKADINESNVHTSVAKTIVINIPKIENVDFSYTVSKTNPKEYYFTATGESDYGTVDFEWDFGQNNIETGERATALFDEYGFNDITLTARIKNLGDEVEAVSTKKTVEILAPEFKDLDFTYSSNSEDGRILYLKANSKVTYGTVNYKWNFGDGLAQTGEETNVTFDSYGKKTIALTGTIQETGISTTRTMTVDVQPPVFKNFTINHEISSSNPLTVYLTANAESEYGSLSYEWDLGYGVTYTGKSITHTFDSFGEKNITVKVKNTTTDIEDTKTEVITLATPLIENLEYTYNRDKNDPLKVYFTASSTSDYDVKYEWDFGNGEIRTGRIVEMDYTGFGLKNIVLKASVSSLNINSKIEDSFIFEAPTITELDFDYQFDKKNNYNAYFTSTGKCDYGELEYEWDFGFGNKFKGSSLNHTFKYYDSYPISLTAKIKNTNISKTVTKSVEVKEPAFDNFDFTYEVDEKNPLLVYFYATGTSEQGTVSFEWDFSKGNTDSGKTTNFQFDSFGKKTVYLTAKNTTMNVTDTINKEIELTAPEIKNLNFDYSRNKYEPFKATFTASSTSDYEVIYEWDFGDGKVKTGKVIDIEFEDFGTKNITLKATISKLGIKSEYVKEINFTEPHIKNLTMQYYPDRKNKLKYNFTASAEVDYGELEYEWDFGDGNIKQGNNINFTFDYYDAYNITLYAKVIDTKTKNKINDAIDLSKVSDIDFQCSYIPTNETEADFLKATCKPDLGDKILTSVKYEWDFGDPASGIIENSSSDERAVHKFTRSDLYKVTLCVNANELITPLCVSKDISILEEPVTGLSYNNNTGYSLKDGKDTWGRELRLTNVWKELIKDGRIGVTSVIFNSHIGCYGKDDQNINGTRTITEKDANTDLLARAECDAEDNAGSRRGNENVTYTLKNGYSRTKENM